MSKDKKPVFVTGPIVGHMMAKKEQIAREVKNLLNGKPKDYRGEED